MPEKDDLHLHYKTNVGETTWCSPNCIFNDIVHPQRSFRLKLMLLWNNDRFPKLFIPSKTWGPPQWQYSLHGSPPKNPQNPQPVLRRRKECEPRTAGVESGRDHECFKVQLESPVDKNRGEKSESGHDPAGCGGGGGGGGGALGNFSSPKVANEFDLLNKK